MRVSHVRVECAECVLSALAAVATVVSRGVQRERGRGCSLTSAEDPRARARGCFRLFKMAAVKLPPLQYHVASDDQLETLLAEPGLKGVLILEVRADRRTRERTRLTCSILDSRTTSRLRRGLDMAQVTGVPVYGGAVPAI